MDTNGQHQYDSRNLADSLASFWLLILVESCGTNVVIVGLILAVSLTMRRTVFFQSFDLFFIPSSSIVLQLWITTMMLMDVVISCYNSINCKNHKVSREVHDVRKWESPIDAFEGCPAAVHFLRFWHHVNERHAEENARSEAVEKGESGLAIAALAPHLWNQAEPNTEKHCEEHEPFESADVHAFTFLFLFCIVSIVVMLGVISALVFCLFAELLI